MAGGDLAAAFKSLAEDAAQAGEKIGRSAGRFIEDTADKEDASVDTFLAAEEANTRAANAIRPGDENLPGGGAGGGSGAGGSNSVSRMLNGDDGAAGGSASGAPEAAGPSGSRSAGELDTAGDPVDVATGDVVLSQADVSLAGVLPLVLERTHRSSHRTGRWLGKSWTSSFDQRLEVYPDRVLGVFSDGRVLTWPRPDEGSEVLTEHGPVRPLRRDGGTWTVTDRQQGLTWRFEQAPGHWWAGIGGGQGELPLASVTDRAGHRIAFSYDEDGAPSAVTHSGGYRLETQLSSERIIALTLAGTLLVRYSYDDAGNLSAVTNSSGQPLRFSYDPAGRLAGWTDRNGHSYSYAYDDRGRCVRGESPSGMLSGTFSYETASDGTGASVTTWTDGAGAVTRYRSEDPFGITGVVDPLGHESRTGRDERGRVTAVADQIGRVTRYEFDDHGDLVTVTRPDGSVVRASYDAQGLPARITEPGGTVWEQSFDDSGNRISVTAPDGAVTRYAYDENAHLAAVTAPDGSVTAVACDAAGLPVTVTGPDGSVTTCERDQFGRVRRITGPDGGGTLLTWTAEGRPVTRTAPDGSVESWEWDGEGNLLQHAGSGGAVTSYAYGPFDKLVSVTGPDGTRSEFSYDHDQRLTSVMHGGLTWSYTYDPAGRLTSEADYNGAVTRYGWDPAGQLTSKVNAAGQELTYAYDPLGNLVSQAADGAETVFAYDEAGRLVSARNADATVTFTRDALGRVIAEDCDGRTVRTSYDAAGRVVTRVTPSGAAARWTYDVPGRSATLAAGGQEIRFGFGASGRETRRDLPGGAVFAQEWDALGRLSGQTLSGPEPSPVLQRRSYSYSPDGFLTGLEDLLAGSRAIGLDPAGRVTSVSGDSWSEQYGYDRAGNVTAAAWPSLPSPASSPDGGWLDASGQGPRSVSGTLTREAGTVRYRYDAAGRVVTRTRTRISRKPETWRYTWDADGRLTSVTTPDGSVWRYAYDPFGRRVAKEHLAESGEVLEWTLFTWDGPVLAEQEISGAEVTTWDYQPGSFTPVAQSSHGPAADGSASSASQEEIDRRFYSIVTDLTGAPAELVASDGTLAGRQRRTLWGGTAWDSSGASTPLRFPGQYADDETGLHYNNQRYYDPVTGAYLSPDPLGLAPSPNPHAYVPNPYAEIDPLGLMGCGTGSKDSGSPNEIPTPSKGQRLYRVYGGDSAAGGASWSPTDPRTVANYRDAAGLPSGGESLATNTGRFVIEGELTDPGKVVLQRLALPLDGMKGGLPEYIIPKWMGNGAIRVLRVSGVNPEFLRDRQPAPVPKLA